MLHSILSFEADSGYTALGPLFFLVCVGNAGVRVAGALLAAWESSAKVSAEDCAAGHKAAVEIAKRVDLVEMRPLPDTKPDLTCAC